MVVKSKHNTVRFEVFLVTTKIPTLWQPLLKMETSSYSKVLLSTYQSTWQHVQNTGMLQQSTTQNLQVNT